MSRFTQALREVGRNTVIAMIASFIVGLITPFLTDDLWGIFSLYGDATREALKVYMWGGAASGILIFLAMGMLLRWLIMFWMAVCIGVVVWALSWQMLIIGQEYQYGLLWVIVAAWAAALVHHSFKLFVEDR